MTGLKKPHMVVCCKSGLAATVEDVAVKQTDDDLSECRHRP